jgi:hypothetical protein
VRVFQVFIDVFRHETLLFGTVDTLTKPVNIDSCKQQLPGGPLGATFKRWLTGMKLWDSSGSPGLFPE